MRNMFIVSFDSRKDENAPNAEGIKIALEKTMGVWKWRSIWG